MRLMMKGTIPNLRRQKTKTKSQCSHVTVIAVTSSQSDPVRLRLPIKLWKLLALALIALIGIMAYICISYSYLYYKANASEELEKKISEMELQHQELLAENQNLKQSVDQQELQLQELAELSGRIEKDQEERNKIEGLVREELGLEEKEKEAAQKSESVSLSAKEIKQTLLKASQDILLQTEEYDGYYSIITSEEYQQQEQKKKNDMLRSQVVEYARQFLGGEYIYGKNDPHTGVDCSGFTKYVLGQTAGVSLVRTAAEQSNYGTAVSEEAIRPGDLVFYGNGSNINHVALYIGNGEVIHAANEEDGIIISNWDYRSPVKIRDVIGN